MFVGCSFSAHLSEEEKTQMMGMKGANESNVAKETTATNDNDSDDKNKEDNADWELDQELQKELEVSIGRANPKFLSAHP